MRPITDRILAAAEINWNDPGLTKKLRVHRKRMDALRSALGARAEATPQPIAAVLPKTRVAREARS